MQVVAGPSPGDGCTRDPIGHRDGPTRRLERTMQTEAVQESVRRHGAAVHSLAQRLVGRGPAAEQLTCEVVLQLAAPGRRPVDPHRSKVGVTPEVLAAKSIALAYFGRRTYRDIAGVLGVPPETVKSSIRDGLRTLWGTSSTGDDDRQFAGSSSVSGISW